MAIDYTALKNELQNDPLGLGYATYMTSGADENLALLLNQVRVAININPGTVPLKTVFDAIVPSDLSGLTALQMQALQLVFAIDPVNFASSNTRTILGNVFPGGSATRTNLVALATRNGSRAEQLFGSGTVVTNADILRARTS